MEILVVRVLLFAQMHGHEETAARQGDDNSNVADVIEEWNRTEPLPAIGRRFEADIRRRELAAAGGCPTAGGGGAAPSLHDRLYSPMSLRSSPDEASHDGTPRAVVHGFKGLGCELSEHEVLTVAGKRGLPRNSRSQPAQCSVIAEVRCRGVPQDGNLDRSIQVRVIQ